MAVTSCEDCHGTCWVKTNFCAFPKADTGAERTNRCRWCDTTGFDISSRSDAPKLTVGFRLSLAGSKAFIIDHSFGGIHGQRIIAGIIGHDNRCLIRIRIRSDEVFHPKICRVHIHVPCGPFHHTLNHIGCFRTTGTAIGIHRCGIGETGLNLSIDAGHLILAVQ